MQNRFATARNTSDRDIAVPGTATPSFVSCPAALVQIMSGMAGMMAGPAAYLTAYAVYQEAYRRALETAAFEETGRRAQHTIVPVRANNFAVSNTRRS